MADMIPNKESGKLEPVAVTPDFKGIAQNLKSKGMSYDDIKNKGTAVLADANSVNFDDPEGARPSDKEFVMPPDKGGRVNPALQKLLQAFEELELEESEGAATKGSEITSPQRTPELMQALEGNGTQPKQATIDSSFSLPMDNNTDWSLPLNSDLKEIPLKTENSNKELSRIISGITDADINSVFESLQSGAEDFYANAVDMVSSGINLALTATAENKIKEAQSSEQVIDILKEVSNGRKGNISLSDLRAYSVNKMPEVLEGRSGYVTQNVVRNMFLAQQISKREQKIANSITFLSGVGDILEYAPPILGVASEENSKYELSIQDVLDNIDKTTPEQQEGVIKVAMDTWEKQETLLFENNNSFMTLAQFGALKDTILQAGTLVASGTGTQAQKNQYIETLVNLGFEVTTVTGIFDSVKSLVKYINLRSMGGYQSSSRVITPEIYGEVMGSMNPNLISEKNITVKTPTETTFEEAPQFVDRRKALVKSANEKQTTLFRKTLESEKKDLGSMKSKLSETDVNKEARILSKEKKIKFKSALKEVKESITNQVLIINNRLSAVQGHIIKFDNSASSEAELSRISQLLKDGKMQEGDLFIPTGVTLVKPTMRTSSNVINTEYMEIPLNKTRQESLEGLSTVQKNSGMSTEEFSARAVPSPNSDTEIGLPNSPLSRIEVTDLDLSEGDVKDIASGLVKEVEGQGGTSLARALEKEQGLSLNPIHSATGFKGYSDNDNSIGLFTFLLQDGARGGFKDFTEASQAARLGTAGYESRVVEKDGKFFVEVDVEHYINPDIDTKGLYITPEKPIGVLAKTFLPPSKILGEELFKGIYALKGVHRSVVEGLERRFKESVKFLNPSQGKKLDDALNRGDQNGIEWGNYGEFKRDNDTPDLNVYNAYIAMRGIYNDIYEIRKKNYYNKLRAQNLKFIDLGDGNLGKVLNPNSSVEMKTSDDLVLDLESGTLVKANPKDGMSYVRLTNAVQDAATGQRYVVRINPEKISRLPTDVLNRRVGHIDRMYRDSGWIVKQENRGMVEGVEAQLKPRVTHIMASKADADRVAEETGGISERSRENNDIDALFGDSGSIQFSYGSSHTKKRNEKLSGPDKKPAPVLNAFEGLGKTIALTDLELGTNIFGSLRARFYHEFSDLLVKKGATPFSYKAGEMVDPAVKKSGKEDARLEELYNWHSYIANMASGEKADIYRKIDKGLAPALDPIFNMYNKLPVSARKTDSRGFMDSLQSLTSEVFVVWNPLYQMPQNAVPSIYMALTKGPEGAQALASLVRLRAAYVKGEYKGFSKIMNISESQTKDLMLELRKSGLVDAVGRSNDFLDLSRGDFGGGSTTIYRATVQTVKKYPYTGTRDLFREGQESTIALMNMLSYITEYKRLLKSGKKFDSKGKVEVSFQAQKNLQTQNSMDQFWFQSPNNVMKPFFQFFQNMLKVGLDTVIEPQYRVVTAVLDSSLKLKFSQGRYFGKQAGPYSQTFAQALVTTVLTYQAFGLAGGLGEKLGNYVEDNVRKNNPEIDETNLGANLMDGFITETFNGAVRALGGEAAVDITKTFGPAGIFDMINDYLIEGFPKINPLGASGLISTNIGNTLSYISAIQESDEIGTLEGVALVATEIVTLLPFFKNIEKAAIGAMFEQMPAIKTLSGKAKITAIEGALLAANIQPALVTDYWEKSSFNSPSTGIYDVFKDENIANRVTDHMIKSHARELLTAKSLNFVKDLVGMDSYDTSLPSEVIVTSLKKWAGIAKSVIHEDLHEKVNARFADKALMSNTPTYMEYIGNYDAKAKSGEKGSWLGVLRQKANSQEALEDFKLVEEYADFDDLMYKKIKEQ